MGNPRIHVLTLALASLLLALSVGAASPPPSTFDIQPAPSPPLGDSEQDPAPALAAPVPLQSLPQTTEEPSFLLPSDPGTPVLDAWIGNDHSYSLRRLVVWPTGEVEAAKIEGPERRVESLMAMRVDEAELNELLRVLGKARLLELSSNDIRRILDRQRLPNGRSRSISANSALRLTVTLASYQATARDNPIADFAHSVTLPSPQFYIETYPQSQDRDVLVRLGEAFAAVSRLTVDARLSSAE